MEGITKQVSGLLLELVKLTNFEKSNVICGKADLNLSAMDEKWVMN